MCPPAETVVVFDVEALVRWAHAAICFGGDLRQGRRAASACQPRRLLPLLPGMTRGQCPEERPCPYQCRYRLDSKAWQCALDAADEGGLTLEEVGAAFSVTRERIRQIEAVALGKLAKRGAAVGLDSSTLGPRPSGRRGA